MIFQDKYDELCDGWPRCSIRVGLVARVAGSIFSSLRPSAPAGIISTAERPLAQCHAPTLSQWPASVDWWMWECEDLVSVVLALGA